MPFESGKGLERQKKKKKKKKGEEKIMILLGGTEAPRPVMYPFSPLTSQGMRKLRALNSYRRAGISHGSHRSALTTAPQGLLVE
jgi:hypothetical protein